MSKNPSYNRAIRAIVLQRVANEEIDCFGRASSGVIDRLMKLCDSFSNEEMDLFLELGDRLLKGWREECQEIDLFLLRHEFNLD